MSRRSRLGRFVTAIAAGVAIGTLMFVSAAQADVTSSATGGGTVIAAPAFATTEASFGLNADLTSGLPGDAMGRIEYDRHSQVAENHVTVPVKLMAGEAHGTPTPNGTGGNAVLAGDCTAGECPGGFASVLVYVEDNSDSGAGTDVFRIFYCSGGPLLPPPGFNGTTPPFGCTGPEGGTLRSGNIQVRSAS